MSDKSSGKKTSVPEKDRVLRLKNALRANLKLRKAIATSVNDDGSSSLRRNRPLNATGNTGDAVEIEGKDDSGR